MRGPLRLAVLLVCSAACTTSIPQNVGAGRADGARDVQVGSGDKRLKDPAPALKQHLHQYDQGLGGIENLGAKLMGRHAVQMQLRAAKKHHFQSWLHRFLRGIGSSISDQGGRRENSHLAGAVLRSPLLHPSSVWAEEHTKLEGEDGDSNAEESGDSEVTGEKEEDKEPKEIDISSSIYVDAESFEKDADEWMEKHEQEIRYHMRWILLGGFFFITATAVLIYSEVRYVLMTRECDATLVARKEVQGELAERKESMDEWRPYWSLGAVAGIALSLLVILLSLCALATSMLSAMGYVFRGCAQMALLYSLLVAVIWGLFVVGCCWLCTRPWTGVLLILISLMGESSIESAAAPAVVLWAIFSAGLFYIWFRWGKHMCIETPYDEEESLEKTPLLK